MAFFRGDIFSTKLQMCTGVSVIIPDGVVNNKTNVLYLLHGMSDNCTNWTRLTSIERYANSHKIAVIIPEVQRSMYTDMEYGMKYFSYVSEELIQFAGSMFNLPTARENTFIAGLSMGGFGAMKCAFTKPEQYTACAAFSSACLVQELIDMSAPAVMLNEFKAIYGEDLKVPDEDNLMMLAQKCNTAKKKPRLFMTCGRSDMLYPSNVKLKEYIETLDIEFEYKEWEGDHTWEFWDKSIQLALEFFFGAPTSGTATPLSDGKIV